MRNAPESFRCWTSQKIKSKKTSKRKAKLHTQSNVDWVKEINQWCVAFRLLRYSVSIHTIRLAAFCLHYKSIRNMRNGFRVRIYSWFFPIRSHHDCNRLTIHTIVNLLWMGFAWNFTLSLALRAPNSLSIHWKWKQKTMKEAKKWNEKQQQK